ncbi:endo alpha-1,4 polygalactosaminidase [Geovibrio thiophilus]|uniref:Endo alpha-1,4 polygalactosaminidase n=1 Tax=Geovibrio thiophilus TaxID=139438 RepID=A0A3R5UY60_9BACT|nr:endo alpha-1,4 polygalactosaminidase [Geovibrio thiophilus]QAR33352.1 endo alpha-1,4 polygalactosaminidase [Geovibrio thiophilus]
MRSALRNSFLILLALFVSSCFWSREPEENTPERWQPYPGLVWHIQLQGELVKYDDASVYDIDLFNTDDSMIKLLHSEGKRVICYFSAGTVEDWRVDAAAFPAELTGNTLSGWEGQRWLDVRHVEELAPLMEARLDLAAKKGCDAVDADRVDGYRADTGFEISYDDQLRYNLFLAEAAHKRGLAVGLRNDFAQVADLADIFDFAVSEQCFETNECDLLYPFIQRSKPVFGVEYAFPAEVFCGAANNVNYDFILSDKELDGTFRIPCR